ncbi:hypothetical protein B0T26DRAFT_88127 [Lasiosphaeria miniovina]|uniref:Uncharacterized protein n=1 Tax=Lasiosphaeria miniovina TaxID=1954250 RepID=A0AA40EEW0_9PEZI|nr:uncharacterized protein B0T26DRAFT_88127 [Lasiosphaeria miniovina]KAK0734946.1 hypothetical protein B0T26DRAFT_88127 [Lasiosphaeria miniovina]
MDAMRPTAAFPRPTLLISLVLGRSPDITGPREHVTLYMSVGTEDAPGTYAANDDCCCCLLDATRIPSPKAATRQHFIAIFSLSNYSLPLSRAI